MESTVVKKESSEVSHAQRDPLLLDRAFKARRMVIAGVSSDRGKWSNIMFRRLLDGPFDGELIAVNPARSEVEGQPCYASLRDVPGEVDYVQLLVAREHTVDAVRDCVARKVPVVHVLSSGFGEVSGEGPGLQSALVEALAGGASALIGPNSLGLYSAGHGLCFSDGCHFDPGPVTFISQSGALCTDVLAQGQIRGVKFSKVLSVGNCADLDWPDYVRYCRHDPETGIAVFYIESTSNGRALYEELKRLARNKPVLVLKGGQTPAGAQAVVSHTGRMTGEHDVWQAMMRQAGVIELTGLNDLLVTLQAWSSAELQPRNRSGDGVMVIGCGGGVSVLISDALVVAGLSVARLGPGTLSALKQLEPAAKVFGGIDNPIEMPVDRLFTDPAKLARLIETSAADPEVGMVLLHLNLIAFSDLFGDDNLTHLEAVCAAIRDVAGCVAKPLTVVLRNGDCGQTTGTLYRSALTSLGSQAGLDVFSDLEPALAWLGRVRTFTGCRS
jgi:acyl-CoA synthetase (NDP forming)